MLRYITILSCVSVLLLAGCATHHPRILTEDEQQALRLGHTVHADTQIYNDAALADALVGFARAYQASRPVTTTIRCTTLTGYRKGVHSYHTTCY